MMKQGNDGPGFGRFFIDPQRRRSIRSVSLWTALACALALTWATGRLYLFYDVEYPWLLAASFPAGHLLFGVSQMLSRLSLRQGVHAAVASVRLFYRPYGGATLLFYGLLAIAEELVFRAVPLSFLEGTVLQVVGLAVVFALVHQVPGPGKRFSVAVTVELTLFGVLLGLFFAVTGEFWPLVVVHFIRNGSVAKVFVRKDLLRRRPSPVEPPGDDDGAPH